MQRFDSILVANRGEIAVRILRTARALGYRTVAVYSDADRDALHVSMADSAVCLGPGPAAQSYLDAGQILAAAQISGAQAVHPGYGFLSENDGFAQACLDAGLCFIGPSPDAIRIMGNKAEAKKLMIEAGVPCVPGYDGADQSNEAFARAAEQIGYPVMVKAAAGGGGRGMRLVETPEALDAAIESARSEAANAFGNGALILEKAIIEPRHIEIQVFGDEQGDIIQLGERDCSIQRRHQKIVEEAPSPAMTDALRTAMGDIALKAAAAVHYTGAGTVEFLLDPQGDFYFIEMNTRLQVEHPVTEMITGLDLVGLQIKVAQGEPLGLTQSDIALNGHAIEVRLCAEDPAQSFMPSIGPVHLWRPAGGDGVRVDHNLQSGHDITPFYDPMIGKIIAWGENREAARKRLVTALRETVLLGLVTNKAYLDAILRDPRFIKGEATTSFLSHADFVGSTAPEPPSPELSALGAVLLFGHRAAQARTQSIFANPELANWHSSGQLRTLFDFDESGPQITVSPVAAERFLVTVGEQAIALDILAQSDTAATFVLNGQRQDVDFVCPTPNTVFLAIDGRSATFTDLAARAGQTAEESSGSITAPMHGKIIAVSVSTGDRVEEGTPLAVIEAMKMEHQIQAPLGGTVTSISITPGDQVAAGTVLIEIDAA